MDDTRGEPARRASTAAEGAPRGPLRRLARRVLSPRGRQRIWASVVRGRTTVTALVGAVSGLAPAPLALALKEGLRPRGRLDHPDRRILMELASFAQWDRLRACAKEPETVRWIESGMTGGDVAYDIGANVGAYALIAQAVVGDRGRVYAFEPAFASFAALCQNVLLNGAQGRVVPLPLALGAVTRLGWLRYASTAPGAALHRVTAEAGRPPSGPPILSVPCYRLDDLIPALGLDPPTHIKLDVDGAELDVLRGAEATLAGRQLRSLLVELPADMTEEAELPRLLARHGFRPVARHPHPGPGRAANHIFERPPGTPRSP